MPQDLQQIIALPLAQFRRGGSRLYVQRAIYEETLRAIAERANAMVVGATLDPATEMGPEQLEHFLETKAVWIAL